MTPPAVAVAVCTYRRPDGLARLLAALPAGAPGAAVIVVDNDGADPRVPAVVATARAAGLDVRLAVEPRPGISAARNRAFAEAEAAGIGLLALLDDDEWPAPGWLPALLRRREETGAAVVGGVVRPAVSRRRRRARALCALLVGAAAGPRRPAVRARDEQRADRPRAASTACRGRSSTTPTG